MNIQKRKSEKRGLAAALSAPSFPSFALARYRSVPYAPKMHMLYCSTGRKTTLIRSPREM